MDAMQTVGDRDLQESVLSESQVTALIVEAMGLFDQVFFGEPDEVDAVAAFRPLRERVETFSKDDEQKLRSGIGRTALRDEFLYPDQGETFMELLFESDDVDRLRAARYLYEFFEARDPASKRPRGYGLGHMKTLVLRANELLFKDGARGFERLVRAKATLAKFLIIVGDEYTVADVVKSEGKLGEKDFFGEFSAMLNPSIIQLGAQQEKSLDQLYGLWNHFLDLPFDQADEVTFRLVSRMKEIRARDEEILNREEPEDPEAERLYAHVLLVLADQLRRDADLVAAGSKRNAANLRRKAETKAHEIRLIAHDPAQTAQVAKLRNQRLQYLARAQEAGDREDNLLDRAAEYERDAGRIFDRLGGR